MKNTTIYSVDNAVKGSKPLLETLKVGIGFIPNIFDTVAESPLALKALMDLNEAFNTSSFSTVEKQIIMLATSTENECIYCVAGHSAFSEQLEVDPAVVKAMRNKQPLSNPKLNALANMVRQLVIHRGQISTQVMTDFLGAGYTKTQFFELVLGISLKTFTNYVSNALSVPLDKEFAAFAWQRPVKKLSNTHRTKRTNNINVNKLPASIGV